MYTLWSVQVPCNPGPRMRVVCARRPLTTSIILFACCQGLLLYCAGWTVYQTVPHTSDGWRDYQALFQNRTFVQLAMSLLVCLPLVPTPPSFSFHLVTSQLLHNFALLPALDDPRGTVSLLHDALNQTSCSLRPLDRSLSLAVSLTHRQPTAYTSSPLSSFSTHGTCSPHSSNTSSSSLPTSTSCSFTLFVISTMSVGEPRVIMEQVRI